MASNIRQELDKLHQLLEHALIPPYPNLGSMGGASGAEAKLQMAWEKKYSHRQDEYNRHQQIREQLDTVYEALDQTQAGSSSSNASQARDRTDAGSS